MEGLGPSCLTAADFESAASAIPPHRQKMVWAENFEISALPSQGVRSASELHPDQKLPLYDYRGFEDFHRIHLWLGSSLHLFGLRCVPDRDSDVRHRQDARIAITLESTTLNSSRALTPYD